MSEAARSKPDDAVDPQVREFVTRVSQGFASHPGFADLPHAEARAVAEQVRAPWREGGPQMARTRELQLPCGSGAVRARLHEPTEAAGPRPTLIYLHGGGWTLFSIDTHDRLMREYAARSGLSVLGIDYALSPEAKYPAALDQVTAAIRWLQDNGPGIGVDPRRLAIGGDSAGGNLALAAALSLRDCGDAGVLRAVLLNYAALDVTCSDAAELSFGGPGAMLNRAEMDQYWANYLRSPEDAADPLACPALARLEGLPPVFLAVAEQDILAEQSHALAGRLAAAGVQTRLAVYEGATHSFLEAVSISALADRALQEASDWLKRATA
jgi:acetyl esterase